MGSGWIYDKFKCSHLELAKYNPLSGSGQVDIPQKLKAMRSVISIEAPDNRCFIYTVVAGLLLARNKHTKRAKHMRRYTKYLPHLNLVDDGDLQYPVRIRDIKKFEETNNLSIAVFQWCTEDDLVVPLKHGSGVGEQVDLLYVEDDIAGHYMLIKNFNAFMRHRTKYHNAMFWCRKCLHGFVNRNKQIEHSILCKQGINQIVKHLFHGKLWQVL